jgi:hypothetical protein
MEKKRRKKSFKIFSSFSCRKQKEVLVLHPLWDTGETKRNTFVDILNWQPFWKRFQNKKNKSSRVARFEKNR